MAYNGCGLLARTLDAGHLLLGTPQQSHALDQYLFVKRNVERAIFLVNLLYAHAYSNPPFSSSRNLFEMLVLLFPFTSHLCVSLYCVLFWLMYF